MRDFDLIVRDGQTNLEAEILMLGLFIVPIGTNYTIHMRTYITELENTRRITNWNKTGNTDPISKQEDSFELFSGSYNTGDQNDIFGNSTDLRFYVNRITLGKKLDNGNTEVFVSTSKASNDNDFLIKRLEVDNNGNISNITEFLKYYDSTTSEYRRGIIAIEYSKTRDSLFIAFAKNHIVRHGYRTDTTQTIPYANHVIEIPRSELTDSNEINGLNTYPTIGTPLDWDYRVGINYADAAMAKDLRTGLKFASVTDIAIDGNLIYISDSSKGTVSIADLDGNYIKEVPILGANDDAQYTIQDDPHHIAVDNKIMVVNLERDDTVRFYL